MHKRLDEFEIQPDPTTGFHGNRYYYNLKNDVATFSRLFLMGSFLACCQGSKPLLGSFSDTESYF